MEVLGYVLSILAGVAATVVYLKKAGKDNCAP